MHTAVRRSIIYMILSMLIVVALLLVWRVMNHPQREGGPPIEKEETRVVPNTAQTPLVWVSRV